MPVFCRALLMLSILTGCEFGGGGGSVHVPPESISYSEVTLLRLELSVSSGPLKVMKERNTDVTCHYKPEKAASYKAISGRVESESDRRMIVVFDLPPLATSDGTFVEYYFDMKLDGHYNKRDTVRVALR